MSAVPKIRDPNTFNKDEVLMFQDYDYPEFDDFLEGTDSTDDEIFDDKVGTIDYEIGMQLEIALNGQIAQYIQELGEL